MNLRSLGYRTDLFFPRFEGEVVDCGRYTAIRTPTNPTFYWGNFLIFDRPPAEGDFARWTALFAQEIGAPPKVHHVALGWDSPEGDHGVVQPFLEAGYDLEESVVLTTQSVHRPAKYCDEAEVRPLKTDREWETAVEIHVACREPEYSEAGYREFSARKMAHSRAMVTAGLGQWFGAFIEGELAADLGIFVTDGLARFQTVGTAPKFRRRGICSALVHQSAEYALTQMSAQNLVMVADVHYHAAKIYESIGFTPTERQLGLTWWERNAE